MDNLPVSTEHSAGEALGTFRASIRLLAPSAAHVCGWTSCGCSVSLPKINQRSRSLLVRCNRPSQRRPKRVVMSLCNAVARLNRPAAIPALTVGALLGAVLSGAVSAAAAAAEEERR